MAKPHSWQMSVPMLRAHPHTVAHLMHDKQWLVSAPANDHI